MPDHSDFPPPPQLDDDEAAIWRELAPSILSEWPAAAILLADCCYVIAALKRQREILAREGAVVPGYRGRMVRNRRCAVVQQLREEFWRYNRIFGLTPLARVRLEARQRRLERQLRNEQK